MNCASYRCHGYCFPGTPICLCASFSIHYFSFQDYGHRVRLATHANFKEFVLTAGLEFYPLGGDPKVLAECT